MKAGDLKLGETLLAANGSPIKVAAIEHQNQSVEVYNFEVEDFHTYYVGSNPVLVHNTCAAKETQFIYRGLPAGTERYNQALQGIVKPRGTALDIDSLVSHVKGEDVLAGVTSWSRDPAVAARFAGDSGKILKIPLDKVTNRIVPRPFVGGKYQSEQEILLKGTLNLNEL